MTQPIPYGVSPEFDPVWEEFCKMKAIHQLQDISSDACVEECFRLLVRQTGERVKSTLSLRDFVKATGHRQLKALFRKYGLTRNCQIDKHEYSLRYERNDMVCVALDPVVIGTLVLTCRPFGLKYVLNTLDNRLWRERPVALLEVDALGRDRKFTPYKKLKDREYHPLKMDGDVKLEVARTEHQLVFRYTFGLAPAIPLYPRLDLELKKYLLLVTRGVF